MCKRLCNICSGGVCLTEAGSFRMSEEVLMAGSDLMTVEQVDAEIRRVWHFLGSSIKASRDAAAIRIDGLLEQRYALSSGVVADAVSEPEAT